MDAQDALRLRRLLDARPVAALATLHRGEPALSMVPFVLRADDHAPLIHVSALATHTRDMREHPRVSLMVMAEATPDVMPQALPRVALQADARTLPREGAEYDAAKALYLARFPDATMTFELADFAIVVLTPVSARLVAGFGRADALVGERLAAWLRS
ncbi:pyridoxamine 5'-phosphate oxidase family protein [Piscinibacter sp.]|uniref:pyridoxamine 5'-phosphate oxidase family protein n=1 Tax=Piscinibacter sp. TaxID=1903157 RepID=UPI0039E67604